MLMKIRNRLRWRSESGDSELVSMVLMIPISVFLLLSFIDLSVYFNVRAGLQQQALNGARLTALYGGSRASLSTNATHEAVYTTILNNIYTNGKCVAASGCPRGYVPRVSCVVINDAGTRVTIADRAGQDARCDIAYKFQPVVQGDIFGFVGITTSEFHVQGNYYTETGFDN